MFIVLLGMGWYVYRIMEFGEEISILQQENSDKKIFDESEKIAESYQNIYENAVKKNTLDTVETIQEIVDFLGQSGYVAVDNDHEINMVNEERMEDFCRQAEQGEDASLMLLAVRKKGGFIRYDFRAEKGTVHVTCSSLDWEEGQPVSDYKKEYTASSWSCTEKGWLFFEEYHPAGYDGDSGHTAIRVKPLADSLRELNRRYLEPVSYAANNMFLADWSENNYGELDFDDLYEPLYEMCYKKQFPYEFSYTPARYEVTKEEFEKVFQTYFHIDSRTLREKTDYLPEKSVYRYSPRGLYDMAGACTPFSEVVGSRENEDGTLTLQAEAVWPKRNLDQALVHEVTIRPLSGGSYQYVSNRVISNGDGAAGSWYTERLPVEEWETKVSDEPAKVNEIEIS